LTDESVITTILVKPRLGDPDFVDEHREHQMIQICTAW